MAKRRSHLGKVFVAVVLVLAAFGGYVIWASHSDALSAKSSVDETVRSIGRATKAAAKAW